jgi:hypothetical protein
MINILQRGATFDLPLDPANTTGIPATDVSNAYLLTLVRGTIVKMGYPNSVPAVEVVNGGSDLAFFGFIVEDALYGAGSYNNCPHLASKSIPVCYGGGIIETDQVDSASGLTPGTPLYVDSAGKLTSTGSTGLLPVGIVLANLGANPLAIEPGSSPAYYLSPPGTGVVRVQIRPGGALAAHA